MKAIMISIKPKWVAKILNGEKTIEIRKTMPKCDLPIDVYIYCTKDLKSGKKVLTWLNEKGLLKVKTITYLGNDILGKVVAKFTLKKCEEWHNYSWQEITKNGCVSDDELRNYCKNHKSLYIWHIDNLEIFGKPKELSEFRYAVCPKTNCEYCKYNKTVDGDLYCTHKTLTKAPQNFCNVDGLE